ncbi:unnamed protein product [Gongylonema pulchrum]|uniref:Uncharacterized protein n=1 Tax=Gongylonema pulchrum TaxID=637853 RepID=A0A3P7P2L4_9BILA|nr:unnamed protein product [Gongylonema pulchrum]
MLTSYFIRTNEAPRNPVVIMKHHWVCATFEAQRYSGLMKKINAENIFFRNPVVIMKHHWVCAIFEAQRYNGLMKKINAENTFFK